MSIGFSSFISHVDPLSHDFLFIVGNPLCIFPVCHGFGLYTLNYVKGAGGKNILQRK
jgi:hypothetical protein